jgi:hypothetical protein
MSARALAVAAALAVAGCKAGRSAPRCELHGGYVLSFVVGGETHTLGLRVPDPMESFRPSRDRSDEYNREKADYWRVARFGGELVSAVPALGITLEDKLFFTADYAACTVKVQTFPAYQTQEVVLTLAVDRNSRAVTGRVTGSVTALATGVAITGERQPLVD